MPKIHKYSNSDSIYIKARHQGRMTTYQVTARGAEALKRQGSRPEGGITTDALFSLIASGDAYTGKSGPGMVTGNTTRAPLSRPVRAVHTSAGRSVPPRVPRATTKEQRHTVYSSAGRSVPQAVSTDQTAGWAWLIFVILALMFGIGSCQ